MKGLVVWATVGKFNPVFRKQTMRNPRQSADRGSAKRHPCTYNLGQGKSLTYVKEAWICFGELASSKHA